MPTSSGLLVVISSPSGGGKDAVINALLNIFPGSTRLVTTTSRPPRPGQKNGVDYHFVSQKKFEEKIKNNELVEYNIYAENYYGTESQYLKNDLAHNNLVLTQIEVNGKHNLDKSAIPHLSIFLLPESLDILKKRITKRGGITPAIIEKRMQIAKNEIAKSRDYDYQIVNKEGKLNETIDRVAQIIQARLAASHT
ncbi:MAG: guanylate kinase [Candidatus Magasanikbacteria bacterium]